MDALTETPFSPEAQAQNLISDLNTVSKLPEGQKPDLTLAGRISSQYRSVPDHLWDKVFPTTTIEDLKLTDHRFDIVDVCDQIVAASRPKPPEPTPFADPEHLDKAENIRLHHQLADTVITKQKSLFLDRLPPEIEAGLRREKIGSQEWITFRADLMTTDNPPVQIYHTTDTASPQNPTEIFFFRRGNRTYMASYSGLKPDQPQVPEVLILRIEDKNSQGEISRTEISSASSGSVTSVEVNGKNQNPQDSKRIISETIAEISDFHPGPPSEQQILDETDPQNLIDNILKDLKI